MDKARTLRRLFSVLLACALALMMLPATAFADETTASSGEGTSQNPYVVSDAGSLNEALTKGNEGTTTYITLGASFNADVVIPKEKTVSLNLNGKTLTNATSHTITVQQDAQLTVTGSGTVDNVSNGKAAVYNDAGGYVVLNGGIYDRSRENGQDAHNNGDNSYYTIKNFGTMVVNSGVTVQQDGTENGGTTGKYSSLFANGWQNGAAAGTGSSQEPAVPRNGAVLTINGGAFIGGLNTIKNDDYGSLTINGGTFENFAQSCLLNWNLATISGGTFEGGRASSAVILNGYDNDTMDKGVLNILGGDFTGRTIVGKMNGVDRDVQDVAIAGGIFSNDVSAYCEEGYKVANINGKAVVVTDTADAVATVGGHGFNSVSNAVAIAQNEDVVRLMQNSTDFLLNVPDGIQLTLDLGGNVLSMTGRTGVADVAYANGTTASLVNQGNLTIQNGTLKGTGQANTIVNKQSANLTLASDLNIETTTASGACTVVNLGGTVTTSSNITNGVGDGIVTYGGELDIKGGSVVVTGYHMSPVTVFNREYKNESAGASVIMEAGTLKGDGYAISTNNVYSGGDKPSNVTIFGGSISSGLSSIYWPSSGTLSIGSSDGSGPDITSEKGSAVEVCSGTLNISGGEFVGQGKTGQTDQSLLDGYVSHSGAGNIGDAVTIIARRGSGYNSADLKVLITGGTFSSNTEYAIRYLDCKNPEDSTQEFNVSVVGGKFAGAIGDIDASSVADDAKQIVSGGYFTSDPSAYVVEDMVALPSDMAGYAFMVGEANKNVDVTPAAGGPEVDMTLISGTYQDDVENAAKSISDNGVLAAAANKAAHEVTKEQIDSAKKAYGESGIANAGSANPHVYVQTYLDIEPTAYDPASATMTLDITPMCRVVASTATSPDGIVTSGDGRNAVVLEGSAKELTDIETMTLSITLPSGFAAGATNLYVKHVKDDGRTYFYTGAVAGGALTFTNPNGFSEFTISKTNGAVAEIDGIGYATLQQAVDEVAEGQTIRLLDNNLSATVSKPVSFKVEANGKTGLELKAGPGYSMSPGADGTYTFTYVGGGSVPPAPEAFDVSVAQAEHGSVSVEPAKAAAGETVVVTATPDEGYLVSSVEVTDASGEAVEVSEGADGAYSFKMPEGGASVSASFEWDNPYSDVSGSDWFYPAVEYVTANGVMRGYQPDYTLFGPYDELSRGMMVQVLYNMAGSPEVAYAGAFSDVPEGSTYADAAEWAAAEGIAEGYGDTGVLGVDDALTREQMAVFMHRYAEWAGDASAADASALDGYPDAGEVSEWAAEGMAWAVEAGVVHGVGGTELQPLAPSVRAYVAQMLANYLTAE